MNKKELLNNLKISDLQYDLYVNLLKTGPLTILELSKITGTSRTTIHQNIEKLVKLGLISETFSDNKRRVFANEPSIIKDLIIQNEQSLKVQLQKTEDLKKTADTLINNLTFIKELKPNEFIDIEYHRGKAAIAKLYDKILSSKTVHTYVEQNQVLNYFPENFDKFGDAVYRGTEIWDLSLHGGINEEFLPQFEDKENYHYKFFPKGIKIEPMDYLIFNDSLAIIQSDPELSAIVIKSKVLADNSRVLYKLLWDFLPEANYSDLS